MMGRMALILIVVGALGIGAWLPFLHAEGEPERGFLCREYTAPDGSVHKYSVFVPFAAEEKPPLIVYLNGHGKNGSDGVLPLRDGLGPVIWETKATFPFVAVFPQCSDGSSWRADGPDAQRALAIMEEVAREYHTDPERVYLTGLSTGGAGVWSIAGAHPEKFAAIAPISAVSYDEAALDRLVQANMPIWMFFVADDPQVPEEFREELRRKLIDAGTSPRYTVVEGTSHSSWDIAFRTPAFYRWLLEQRRGRNGKPAMRFQPLLIDESLTGWHREGQGNWSYGPDGVLTCVSGAEGEVGRLVTDESFRDFEFHVEFQATPAGECSLSLLGRREGVLNGAWSFVVMPPELGSGGLYDRAGERWLASTDLVAQRGLRQRGWNDCRITVVDDRMTVKLNGLVAVDYELPRNVEEYAVALDAPATPGMEIRWRDPRIGVIEEETSVDR